METFGDWLLTRLEDKGWPQAELARRAQMGNATLSRIISGTRRVGPDVASRIARALGESPETVFRLAGLLPGRMVVSEYDDETRRDVELIAEILSRLSPARRRRMAQELVHIARLVEEVEQNQLGMAVPAPKAEVEAE